jgi:hypothetical protein
MGKDLWSYWCDDLTHVQGVLRWYAGLWAFSRKVTNCLVWAYAHHEGTRIDEHGVTRRASDDRHTFAVPHENGEITPTEDYLGFQQGIVDCRMLEGAYESTLSAAIARIKALTGEVPHPMFRRLVGAPMFDMDQIAQELQAIMDE